MSLVAITLNLLLSTLLIAALVIGWRVERRLRTLKEGQALFANSVAELNAAAARAETGLSDLKSTMSEASETLSGRLEDARRLVGDLDRRITAAQALPDAPPVLALRRRAAEVLTLDEPLAKIRPEARPEVSVRAERPVMPHKSRARIDDDLFEEPAENARRASR